MYIHLMTNQDDVRSHLMNKKPGIYIHLMTSWEMHVVI